MSELTAEQQTIIDNSLAAANQCLETQQFEEAAILCQNILSITPDSDTTHFLLALANIGLSNAIPAETHIKKAIAINPSDWQYHTLLGNLLFNQNRLSRAAKSYEKALQIDPKAPEALNGIAEVHLKENKVDHFMAAAKRFYDLHPTSPAANKLYGSGLCMSGNVKAGIPMLKKALEHNPNDLETLGNLASGLRIIGDHGEAQKYYNDLLTLKPEDVQKRLELASLLYNSGEHDAGIDVINAGLAIAPEDLGLRDKLGFALLAKNDVAGARDCFEKIIADAPEYAQAHAHLAFAHLADGDYEKAWPEYEWRLKDPSYPAEARHFPVPLWDGSTQKDATLLLYTEQGAGDGIQFARFIKLASQKLGRIVLAHTPDWEGLFDEIEGADVITTGGDIDKFHYHLPLMSLPGVLGITLESLPDEVPYLKANPQKKSKWAEKFSQYDGLKIGVVASGNPAQRINPLRSFDIAKTEGFMDMEGATFFSLQVTPDGFDTPKLPGSMIDLSPELSDYSETIAAIDELDVIVSTCTSVAHLAGALGKPTLVMLSKSADWRWMLARNDSPWYPTATLIRQKEQNNWDDVIGEVKIALENMTRS